MKAPLLLLFTIFQNFGHPVSAKWSVRNNACPSLIEYPFAPLGITCKYNPDAGATPAEMAARRGYPAETHYLTTSDGYILTVFRILPKSFKVLKSPIFIQGEMVASSAYFASAGDRSLAFNLADEGHDVWLGNLRGTAYSQQHVTLTIDDAKFWDFDWDTLKTDVQDQLNYVASETGKGGKIIYMGHCLGNSLFYIFAIENGEEAKSLVQGTVSLAPANYLDHSRFFKPLVPILTPALETLQLFGIHSIFVRENIYHLIFTKLFRILPHIGKFVLDVIFGPSNQFPVEDLLVIWNNYIPSGSSVKELLHLLQISGSGKFRKFDYGKRGNLKRYNTTTPTEYDLSKIQIPAYLFYGLNDHIADPKDAQRTFQELGSTDKAIYKVPKETSSKYEFAHLDFVNGLYVKKYLFQELLIPLLREKFS